MADGLKSLAEGRSDILKVDPRKLHIKMDWNSRVATDPANIEHIEMLRASIAEVGVKEPLTVYWEDNKAWLSDGHCRLAAVLQLIKEGVEIKTVPVKSEERYSNEADRLFSQVIRNSGKALSPLEQGALFKKLLALGWQQQDIAKKAGISASRVSQVLDLQMLPEGIKAMVANGEVSAGMAVKTLAEAGSGTKAEQELKAALVTAKSQGRTKAMPKDKEGGGEQKAEKAPSASKAVREAFEYADIDDSQEDFVIVKLPIEQWEVIRKVCKL